MCIIFSHVFIEFEKCVDFSVKNRAQYFSVEFFSVEIVLQYNNKSNHLNYYIANVNTLNKLSTSFVSNPYILHRI